MLLNENTAQLLDTSCHFCVTMQSGMDRMNAFFSSRIVIGKSGNAFQLVYFKSIYVATISSYTVRFCILLLYKIDVEI